MHSFEEPRCALARAELGPSHRDARAPPAAIPGMIPPLPGPSEPSKG